MKVALHNLGCKVNAYETEAMAELLKKAASAVDELCKKDAGKAQEILDVVSKERFFEDKSHII